MDAILEALGRPEAYPHPTEAITVAETHISWVFLTGIWAYKVKKPVNLGFLDFSTLEKRAHYCHEEVRLNRRLAADLYIDVVPITRSDTAVRVGGDGAVIGHAVKMRQFDRSQELDRLLAGNRLTARHIDSIIDTVAAFHLAIPPADQDSEYGRPEKLILPLLENFRHTSELVACRAEELLLEKVRTWVQKEHLRLTPRFFERKAGGFIRHCHGDMHTGNMVWQKDRVLIFDCIEFSPALYMIDVTSDIAFLFMDLQHSGNTGLAWRFLNGWLSATGDYESLRLLRFYSLYRATVRAKVTAIRYEQEADETRRHTIREEHLSYVRHAFHYTQPTAAHLMITCGVSGSGKSTHGGAIALELQAVHIRSDIERKRLAGIPADTRSSNCSGIDIYTAPFTEKTYRRLAEIAATALEEGFAVLVDATFLGKGERRQFRKLARQYGCRFTILHFHADEAILRVRVKARLREGRDPSEADEAVLQKQLAAAEPLSEEELSDEILIDTGREVDYRSIANHLRHRKESP
jgi:aminoglycoside phosphotransferase family enzyme/predicted kinase